MSWDLEGEGLYLEDGSNWVYTEGHFEPLQCNDHPCPAQECSHGAWAGFTSDGRHYALTLLEDGQRYFRVVDTADGHSTDRIDGEPKGFRPEG